MRDGALTGEPAGSGRLVGSACPATTARPPSPRRPADVPVQPPAEAFEIPLVRRSRISHGRNHQRRRCAGAVLLVVAVVGLLGSAVVVASVRPEAAQLPAVVVSPVMPPVGGFGVPAGEMAPTLATLLPLDAAAQLRDTSYVDHYTPREGPSDDEPVGFVAVQVGTATLVEGAASSVVRVEVRRAVPGDVDCADPVLTCVDRRRDGGVVARVARPGTADGAARGELARGVVATWPGVVQVRVEELITTGGEGGGGAALSFDQLEAAAQSPLWRG